MARFGGISTEPREKSAESLMVPENEEMAFSSPREREIPSTPFDRVFDAFLETRGERLEMMARTTPAM